MGNDWTAVWFTRKLFLCLLSERKNVILKIRRKLIIAYNVFIKIIQYFLLIIYSSSNGREARNRAEKNRRDKLNYSIQELSTMVNHVANSPRRVDKTAVLRFSAHGLRIEYGKFD